MSPLIVEMVLLPLRMTTSSIVLIAQASGTFAVGSPGGSKIIGVIADYY